MAMGVFEFVIYQFRNRCFYFPSKQTNSKNYVKYLTTVRKSIEIFELFCSECFHFKVFKANVSPVYQIQISMSLVLASIVKILYEQRVKYDNLFSFYNSYRLHHFKELLSNDKTN